MEQILNRVEGASQSPNKPKLTMKFLHVLIKEIQLENVSLVQRVNVLEQQLGEINQMQAEIATANEQQQIKEELMLKEIQAQEIHAQEIQERGIQVSRADRHTPIRKQSFWFLW